MSPSVAVPPTAGRVVIRLVERVTKATWLPSLLIAGWVAPRSLPMICVLRLAGTRLTSTIVPSSTVVAVDLRRAAVDARRQRGADHEVDRGGAEGDVGAVGGDRRRSTASPLAVLSGPSEARLTAVLGSGLRRSHT